MSVKIDIPLARKQFRILNEGKKKGQKCKHIKLLKSDKSFYLSALGR